MAEAVKNMLKALWKPAVAALVVGLLLMSDPNSALAASGGRMGGSSFSSGSSSSSSSYSTRSSDSDWESSWSYSSSSSPSRSYSTSSSWPIGLLGSARSLQTDLNRIAEIADTSTSEGLHYVLTETVLALLRHPDYCISGYSSITILVAAEGEQELPSVNNSIDLKEALQKLASILSSKIMAVEVLWTPQHEEDTLSEQELLKDYPLLRPL